MLRMVKSGDWVYGTSLSPENRQIAARLAKSTGVSSSMLDPEQVSTSFLRNQSLILYRYLNYLAQLFTAVEQAAVERMHREEAPALSARLLSSICWCTQFQHFSVTDETLREHLCKYCSERYAALPSSALSSSASGSRYAAHAILDL